MMLIIKNCTPKYSSQEMTFNETGNGIYVSRGGVLEDIPIASSTITKSTIRNFF